MKSEMARGLFLAVALGVTAIASAAWHQPGPRILETHDCPPASECSDNQPHRKPAGTAKPDSNLLLLMFGLSGALKGEQ